MGKPGALLDSSVLITALLSSRGGSFYLIANGKRFVTLQTSEYVLAEVSRVLLEKFPRRRELRSKLFLLLGIAGVVIFPYPPRREVEPLEKLISPSDAPILATALRSSDYLVTLDNDFLHPRVRKFAARRGVTILKPRAFIPMVWGIR